LVAGTTTYNFAAYAASNGSVEIIELDSNRVAGGLALPQTSTGAPQGNFALNFAAAVSTSGGYVAQDTAGQITAGVAGILAGSLYVNNNGTLTTGAALVSGTAIAAPDSNGRAAATLKTASLTFVVAYYTVDGNTVLMIEADRARVLTGAFEKQF